MKELQLLKWLLVNPHWIPKTHTELFSDAHSQRVFLIMKRYTEAGKEISVQSLEYLLRDKPEYLITVQNIDQSDRLDKATALIIADELRIVAKQTLLRNLQQIDLTDKKLYDASLKKLLGLESQTPPKELSVPVKFTDWKQHIADDIVPVPSGFPFLRNTGTDTKVGDLVNFIAASGNFKTGAMTHMVKHQVMNNKNVLFFSMEESSQTFISRVGQGILETETVHSYGQLSALDIARKFQDKKMGNLDVISGEMIIIEELEDKILDLEETNGYKYDFIIIDYSAQITSNKFNKNSQEHLIIAEIFRTLKVINLNHNKITVTAIQSNRGGYGKKQPDVENSAGSMGGVHAADLMISCKYVANPNAIRRATPSDEQATDIKGFVKLTVVKKRTGTVNVGDWFYFEHRASGNMIQANSNEFDESHWDDLFNVEAN